MKRLAFFCVLITVSIGLAQDKPSAVGTWKLDIAHSDFGSDPAPKSLTLIILKDTPQMTSWRVRGVDDKGKPFAFSWSGPVDGSMHPMMVGGKPSGGQQSGKREQDGTIVRHGEDSTDGSSFDARSSESSDGSTITDEITAKSKDGKESKEKQVWHRVGSASAKPAS
jgi:hypothetical protein